MFSIASAGVTILITVIESKNNLYRAWNTATRDSIFNDGEKHEVPVNTEELAF